MAGRPAHMRFTTKIIAGAVSAAMLLAGPAFAQTSAQQGYSTPGGVVQTQLGNTPASAPSNQSQPTTSTSTPSKPAPAAVVAAKPSTSKLPFTGLDIGLIVAAGGILLAMGLGIRRLSRPADTA